MWIIAQFILFEMVRPMIALVDFKQEESFAPFDI